MDEDRNYSAELLHQMYNDPVNKLYLAFLQPIVTEINRVNKLYLAFLQPIVTEINRVNKLYLQPIAFLQPIVTEINRVNKLYLQPIAFLQPIVTEINRVNKLYLQPIALIPAADRHRDQPVLPSDVELLENLVSLSPATVLSPLKPPLVDVSFVRFYSGRVGDLQQEWARIGTVSWTTQQDTEDFWIDVVTHTDASGEQDFQHLGGFILSLLSLPFSNAAVEWVFSTMNIVKTKLRNRMQQDSLEKILHVRGYMSRHGRNVPPGGRRFHAGHLRHLP
ncbi:hypothetical protein NP493_826g01025 [Ridgeia piscesae]|uniref:HAT C-terminal dimerisation domain-containing protein n=1 Tax=Ridgeia piscesae TaxID=27915 RepID=A0AAD9KMK6_RIDPI|nr:hypothetical protein NP493_826g01025 [Ridgeia piscesae]